MSLANFNYRLIPVSYLPLWKLALTYPIFCFQNIKLYENIDWKKRRIVTKVSNRNLLVGVVLFAVFNKYIHYCY